MNSSKNLKNQTKEKRDEKATNCQKTATENTPQATKRGGKRWKRLD